MSEDTLWPLIGIILFISCTIGVSFIDYLKKLIWNQNMFDKISWVAEESSYSNRLRNKKLISYIKDAQNSANISDKFCIDFSNESEKIYAEEILDMHKNAVIKDYFTCSLEKSKLLCKLSSLEYYMLSLHNFFKSENEKRLSNLMDKSFKYTDRTYTKRKLTEFGKVYYKLDLIVFTFVDKNEKIRKILGYQYSGRGDMLTRFLEENQV